jgi:hypothetical protein
MRLAGQNVKLYIKQPRKLTASLLFMTHNFKCQHILSKTKIYIWLLCIDAVFANNNKCFPFFVNLSSLTHIERRAVGNPSPANSIPIKQISILVFQFAPLPDSNCHNDACLIDKKVECVHTDEFFLDCWMRRGFILHFFRRRSVQFATGSFFLVFSSN